MFGGFVAGVAVFISLHSHHATRTAALAGFGAALSAWAWACDDASAYKKTEGGWPRFGQTDTAGTNHPTESRDDPENSNQEPGPVTKRPM